MNKTIFGTKQLDKDYHLIERSFKNNLPKLNKKTVSIPGMNGVLDFTDYPLGYPTFGMREPEWTFSIRQQYYPVFEKIVNDFINEFYGKRIEIYKSEIPDYHFEGKITSIEDQKDGAIRTLRVKAECDPYMASNKPFVKLITAHTEYPEETSDFLLNWDCSYPEYPELMATNDFSVINWNTMQEYHFTGGSIVSNESLFFKNGLNDLRFKSDTVGLQILMRWTGRKL